MQSNNKRGPKTKDEVVQKILLLKKTDQEGKLTAKKIRNILLKTHRESSIPQERAINNILRKNKERLVFDAIDGPWSIGACLVYNIPSDILPKLILLKEKLGDRLTIRIAKWFAYLYPVLSPQIHDLYKDKYTELLPQLGLIYEVAKQYARKETRQDILTAKKPSGIYTPDTADLDDPYFIKGDLSEKAIWSNWGALYPSTSSFDALLEDFVNDFLKADKKGEGKIWIDSHPDDAAIVNELAQFMQKYTKKEGE